MSAAILLLVLRLGMALALLAFLFWLLQIQIRAIASQSRWLAAQRVQPISLVIQHPDGSRQYRTFTQGDITIGREPGCSLVFNHPAISGQHAHLYFQNQRWWLEDLQSTNGTYLNAIRLNAPAILLSDDTIKCGPFIITISNLPESSG